MREERSRTCLALLARSVASLSDAEKRILQSAIDRKPVSVDTNKIIRPARISPTGSPTSIARVGGSWTFILGFIVFLVVWTIANAMLLGRDSFDPYPFIFLNLILSMIAALQAPVIMMSQNRQAERDRIDAASRLRGQPQGGDRNHGAAREARRIAASAS